MNVIREALWTKLLIYCENEYVFINKVHVPLYCGKMTYSSIYIYLNKGRYIYRNYDPYLSIFIVCWYQEYAIFFIIAAPQYIENMLS